MQFLVRKIEDEDDRQLLKDGWTFGGLSLFWHPQLMYIGAFTKENALNEHMGDRYVSPCKDLSDENEKLVAFIKKTVEGYNDMYALEREAKELLGE